MIDELVELLTRLILEGFITEAEALEVLEYALTHNALPEGWALPLEFSAAIPSTLREQLSEALLAFADRPAPPSPDLLQDRFANEMGRWAEQWGAGRITLKAWQEVAIVMLVDYYARQAQEGAQRAIFDEEDLFAQVETQIAYLSRFADQMATGRLTSAQVVARARLYSGEGRAIYYEQQGLANQQVGWVEDYIAVDDRNTCGPCSAAEANGPYLPGTGPMPGRVCLGRGYCRCLRLGRSDLAAYRRLVAA